MSEGPIDYEMDWETVKITPVIIPTKLDELREKYRIPYSIELLEPEAYERVCYSKLDCVEVNEHLIKVAMHLSLHPFVRVMLRSYMLAPTQLLPNG